MPAASSLSVMSIALLGAEGPDLTRYLIVCVALIAAVGLAGWGFRRLFAHTLRMKAARRSMQVLDMLPLGGKQRLAVVRCYDRTFLLGLGERETSLVAELDPAPETETEPESELESAEPAFSGALETAAPRLPRVTLRPEGILG